MKILQVSHRVPYPLNEGGTIGIYNYTRGFYEAGHEVTLVALNGIKHQIDMDAARKALEQYCRFYVFDIDTTVKAYPALMNLLSGKSYNVSRFETPVLTRFLKTLLQSETFDLIQVEGTFVAGYFDVLKTNSKAPLVLRQHNVEYQIWERLARNENNPVKKWYLQLLSKRLKTFENRYANVYDALVPVTQDDAEVFIRLGCRKPVFVSPSGIDVAYWSKGAGSEGNFNLFHLGSLEWMPNREAVVWFIENVWPQVLLWDDRFKLFIAGKNMPPSLKQWKVRNVEMVGEVEDGAAFICDKAITVVPLLSGSGIRLKILEAMAAQKLVISTTVGAQGIPAEHRKNILIADTPEQFVDALKLTVNQPELAQSIRQEGYKMIIQSYSNNAVVHKLLQFYRELIETRG